MRNNICLTVYRLSLCVISSALKPPIAHICYLLIQDVNFKAETFDHHLKTFELLGSRLFLLNKWYKWLHKNNTNVRSKTVDAYEQFNVAFDVIPYDLSNSRKTYKCLLNIYEKFFRYKKWRFFFKMNFLKIYAFNSIKK